jgi:hypothetical protein
MAGFYKRGCQEKTLFPSLGGWPTLTEKYNAGLSFTIHRNNWGALLLALFEEACPER